MEGGAALTRGPALGGPRLLQLYQGPHHGRQGAGPVPPSSSCGLLLADALLLLSVQRQRLLALWRRRTPEEQDEIS